MNSPDKEKWIAAMDKEITTLQEKGCWEITIIPTRRNINLLRLFFFPYQLDFTYAQQTTVLSLKINSQNLLLL